MPAFFVVSEEFPILVYLNRNNPNCKYTSSKYFPFKDQYCKKIIQSSSIVTLKHILSLILRNMHCAHVALQIKFNYICIYVRLYSHQESPIVHLLWSGPNIYICIFCLFLFFLFFVAVRFHTSLFASETEIANKTTCAKVIHSLDGNSQAGKTGSAKIIHS